MESLILVPSSRHVSITNSSAFSSDFSVQFTSRKRAINFRASSPLILPCNVFLDRLTPRSYIRYGPPYGDQDDDPEEQVESLRVPDAWSVPSKALEESEWLRVTLHKWLDEEYCPEETNVEISKILQVWLQDLNSCSERHSTFRNAFKWWLEGKARISQPRIRAPILGTASTTANLD
ncbi:hypothetical protein SDJN03_12632, partial [Cucurbita argyrosperma subsp. sororia]